VLWIVDLLQNRRCDSTRVWTSIVQRYLRQSACFVATPDSQLRRARSTNLIESEELTNFTHDKNGIIKYLEAPWEIWKRPSAAHPQTTAWSSQTRKPVSPTSFSLGDQRFTRRQRSKLTFSGPLARTLRPRLWCGLWPAKPDSACPVFDHPRLRSAPAEQPLPSLRRPLWR
jgi:hypothetical protein